MKLLSIQVGQPKEIPFRGKSIQSAIFKDPVTGPVLVERLNLVGDRQSDLCVHGGADKAVYGYGVDAYAWWKSERPVDEYKFGAFGENLSISELREDQIFLGDAFAIGGAILQAVQPRFPCFKLGAMYGDLGILKTFVRSRRPGIYFKVLQEGEIDYGQSLKLVSREQDQLTIAQLFHYLTSRDHDETLGPRFLEVKSLPQEMREQLDR